MPQYKVGDAVPQGAGLFTNTSGNERNGMRFFIEIATDSHGNQGTWRYYVNGPGNVIVDRIFVAGPPPLPNQAGGTLAPAVTPPPVIAAPAAPAPAPAPTPQQPQPAPFGAGQIISDPNITKNPGAGVGSIPPVVEAGPANPAPWENQTPATPTPPAANPASPNPGSHSSAGGAVPVSTHTPGGVPSVKPAVNHSSNNRPAAGGAMTHTVVSGDTMWDIARANGMSLNQLVALNPQVKNPSLIFPGQKINLGGGGAAPGVQPAAAGSGGSYTVVAGDTMWAIAQANGMSLQQLTALNPQIKNPRLIFPGQKINLGGGISTSAGSSVNPANAHHVANPTKPNQPKHPGAPHGGDGSNGGAEPPKQTVPPVATPTQPGSDAQQFIDAANNGMRVASDATEQARAKLGSFTIGTPEAKANVDLSAADALTRAHQSHAQISGMLDSAIDAELKAGNAAKVDSLKQIKNNLGQMITAERNAANDLYDAAKVRGQIAHNQELMSQMIKEMQINKNSGYEQQYESLKAETGNLARQASDLEKRASDGLGGTAGLEKDTARQLGGFQAQSAAIAPKSSTYNLPGATTTSTTEKSIKIEQKTGWMSGAEGTKDITSSIPFSGAAKPHNTNPLDGTKK